MDLGINELTDDVGVGETNNETILGGIVLVLVLDDQALASIVVSLSLTTTTVLNLETLEVGFIFDDFDKWLHKHTWLEWMDAKGLEIVPSLKKC